MLFSAKFERVRFFLKKTANLLDDFDPPTRDYSRKNKL
jgi:hypothetical protein